MEDEVILMRKFNGSWGNFNGRWGNFNGRWGNSKDEGNLMEDGVVLMEDEDLRWKIRIWGKRAADHVTAWKCCKAKKPSGRLYWPLGGEQQIGRLFAKLTVWKGVKQKSRMEWCATRWETADCSHFLPRWLFGLLQSKKAKRKAFSHDGEQLLYHSVWRFNQWNFIATCCCPQIVWLFQGNHSFIHFHSCPHPIFSD